MKYETIRGKDHADCMMQVRAKYGTSAYPVQTKTFYEGGIFGMFGKKVCEVLIMVEELGRDRRPAGKPAPAAGKKSTAGELASALEAASQSLQKPEKKEAESADQTDELSETFRRLQKKKDRLTGLLQEKSKTVTAEPLFAAPKSRPLPGSIPGDIPPAARSEAALRPASEEAASTASDEEEVYLSEEELSALLRWKEPEKEASDTAEKRPAAPADRDRNLGKIRKRLLDAQLSEDFAEHFLKDLDLSLSAREKKELKTVEKKALEKLTRMIQTVPDIAPARGQCRAVLLMGPPGSGKTTSIAKLTAKYHWMEKREVSLYSLDHYRLGATEQLRQYADIMEVPFHAPVSPEEFDESIQRDGAELILIDTSGIGISDAGRLDELMSFADKCSVRLEKHLVLPAHTNPGLLEKLMDVYDRAGFDKILLTMVDESDFIGAFVEYADKYNRPFSFLTNGQKVPDDLLLPEPEALAGLILGDAIGLRK